jgi:hypothetical protein
MGHVEVIERPETHTVLRRWLSPDPTPPPRWAASGGSPRRPPGPGPAP